jgi:hypothetical protein
MPPFPTFILLILMSINLFSAAVNNARWPVSPPIVVLEATSMTRDQGAEMQYLLVRLTDDGKVEWDKYAGNTWERQTSSVSAERVSRGRRALRSPIRARHITREAAVILSGNKTRCFCRCGSPKLWSTVTSID